MSPQTFSYDSLFRFYNESPVFARKHYVPCLFKSFLLQDVKKCNFLCYICREGWEWCVITTTPRVYLISPYQLLSIVDCNCTGWRSLRVRMFRNEIYCSQSVLITALIWTNDRKLLFGGLGFESCREEETHHPNRSGTSTSFPPE